MYKEIELLAVVDVEALAAWNPWWRGEGVPERLAGQPRAPIGEYDEATILTGRRHAGKTTML